MEAQECPIRPPSSLLCWLEFQKLSILRAVEWICAVDVTRSTIHCIACATIKYHWEEGGGEGREARRELV
jgi:hypothetical protein